jgi:hypothetical protein
MSLTGQIWHEIGQPPSVIICVAVHSSRRCCFTII